VKLLGLGDETAWLLLLFFPLKRIIVLSAEAKIDTKILVADQSGIDWAFSGLSSVVINYQCRGTIFRSVWFYLELVLGIYLTHDSCFYLA
jgi:hypothetical protein